MMKYMKSIMNSFPASCPRERAVIVLFVRRDECFGVAGPGVILIKRISISVLLICMAGASGEREWEEMSWEKMNESN